MQLIKIDIVRLQPLQRRVDRIENVLARHALVPRFGTHLAHAFRGEHEARALALQPAAENLLGASGRRAVSAERINVGGIEKIDAAFRGGIKDGDAFELVALKPEIHRSKAEPGNAQAGAAELFVVHATSLARVCAGAKGFFPRLDRHSAFCASTQSITGSRPAFTSSQVGMISLLGRTAFSPCLRNS